MPLDKKPYQMETRGQIEAWLEQIQKTPDAESANMLVARRLISHGLGALDTLDSMRERVIAAEGETRNAGCAAVREECSRIHFADEARRAAECIRKIVGKVAMARDSGLFAAVMCCIDFAELPTLGLDDSEEGPLLQRALADAQAEVERLHSVLADLIDAIESVQDWDTTHVGDCIDRANAAADPPTEPTTQPDEITDRDNARCETCRHWTRVGDSLPNLGRCGMAEPDVNPMMPFDNYCCDHEPTIAAIMNRQWIPPNEPTPQVSQPVIRSGSTQ